MSQSDHFNEEDESQRQYAHPRAGKKHIPTISKFRAERRELEGQMRETEAAQEDPEDESRPKRAYGSVKAIFKDEDEPGKTDHDPYPVANHHYQGGQAEPGDKAGGDGDMSDVATDDEKDPSQNQPDSRQEQQQQQQQARRGSNGGENQEQEQTATEAVVSTLNPKEKRKAMKKTKRHGGGREVTDPVTHLPIVIHDQTEKDMKHVPENEAEPGSDYDTATGLQGASKSNEHLDEEEVRLQRGFNGMQRLFPPPDFADLRSEMATVYQQAIRAGLGGLGFFAAMFFLIPSFWGRLHPSINAAIALAGFLGTAGIVVVGMGRWISKKANEIFDDEVWDASKREENARLDSDTELPESVQWLNRLIASIWPIVNPDLFSSLIDQIEDIMQASLPKVIKMVSVDDMGQGNEGIRILGVRWLPSGAASMTLNRDGGLEKPDNSKTGSSDSTDAEDEDAEDGSQKQQGTDESEDNPQDDRIKTGDEQGGSPEERAGMEAEEGDFINLELALSYRSRSSGKGIKAKAKNAHLYLKFYLPGGVPVPVWVELRGFVAIVRARLQLTPDPPFVSLCTMTFLGQPRARISCVPISRHSVNMLDVPLISSFVQSAIDAAMAEYVAPKSLTLNLKDMLVGTDYKKNTISHGVVWIFIKQARGFKQGDGGFGPFEGSSDSYVSISWGKFGKPVASTRIIEKSQEPDWHEYASILVSPEELNAEEKLRLGLWDSDKMSADDDLGRVELDLKSLIHDERTHNKIMDREDRFHGQDSSEKMAGSLSWSVGYFTKAKITEKQLEQQTINTEIKNRDQLKEHVAKTAEKKLREANKTPDDEELMQQKAQDMAELEDEMICSAPPSDELVSGILSVQIHNVMGLGIHNLQKQDKGGGEDREDEAEQDNDMPDSYCNIIMNHRKIYRTRTKPKNSKPFFNAGTEKFIRDWKNTEVIIAVRDAREREADPLIGLVYLPLEKLLAKRSQIMETYPLVGGVGYGRARISVVWRSVGLHLPPHLRGWDYGTLELKGTAKAKSGFPDSLKGHRIKFRTNMGRCKMYTNTNGPNDEWVQKNNIDSQFLPVRKRYSSPLVMEFRQSSFGPDRTPAFGVLWLQGITEEEDETHSVKVWKGGKEAQARAESCCAYSGMEEGEQPLGEIDISLKLWRGLSGYHKSYAAKAKSDDMRSVMECLDTVTDQALDDDSDDGLIISDSDSDDSDDENDAKKVDSETKKKLKVHTNDDSSVDSSDSGSDSDGDDRKKHGKSNSVLSLSGFKKAKNILKNPIDGTVDTATSVVAPGHVDANDNSRGFRNSMRDYKDHKNQLHRKHRGIMQWRVAREADYLGSKLSKLSNVSRIFHHGEKETGVETEV
ncbi:hypothetical protein PG993_001865 [Apiospora rasikravindrae]|uniref:Meiotically up-regulated gene 190 protein n=1 Tax=Apiospora rasikravindrae TaxID=990691 RepID=A0ABR1UCL9_9PEZI